ncbi:MAG: hypothetical protein JW957_08580 [Candidatus Omnitrophica bacterium]|nr:hypothetical protein [Candidatus Omnitrophota bacterium]
MKSPGRLKLWIDREIQLKLVVYALVSLAVACAIVSIASFYIIWNDVAERVLRAGEFSNLYAASLRKFTIFNIILILFLAVLVTLGMLLLSHKVAGPAYRIRKILKDLQEGKKPAFSLRKGDSLKPMLEELEKLSARYTDIGESALSVVERWKNTEVKDMSLTLALKELENKLVYLTVSQEREEENK